MSGAAKLISGVASLGRALGVSKVAAAGYLKRDDWPFNRTSPWLQSEVPLMLKWAAANLRPANVPNEVRGNPADLVQDVKNLSPVNRAKFNKLLAETAGIKLRNQIMSGDYVDKTTLEGEHLKKLDYLKRTLLGLAKELPFGDEIKLTVEQRIREKFEMLSK